MPHDVFGGGRSADVAEANEEQFMGHGRAGMEGFVDYRGLGGLGGSSMMGGC